MWPTSCTNRSTCVLNQGIYTYLFFQQSRSMNHTKRLFICCGSVFDSFLYKEAAALSINMNGEFVVHAVC